VFPTYRSSESIDKIVSSKQWILGRTDFPYLFAGAGRALARVKTAADCLEAAASGLEADYHAYVGVTSARAAIDAFSGWLNGYLGINWGGSAVNLGSRKFLEAAQKQAAPDLLPHLEALHLLAKDEIDPYRRAAAHHDGIFIADANTNSSDLLTEPSESRRWVIQRPELWGITGQEEEAAALLRRWAAEIESSICAVLRLASEPI
jgi:hypothetical protein